MPDSPRPVPEPLTGWCRQPAAGAPAQPGKPRPEYEHRKLTLHNRLIDTLNVAAISQLPEESRRAELRPSIERLVDSDTASGGAGDRDRLVADLLDEVLGLGPLEMLLRDPLVSDILVNGPHQVYVERGGQLELSDVRFRDDAHVMQIIDRIVSKVGRRVDESSPLVDARLSDGSRFNAVIPPLALRGPTISIRRFGKRPLTLDDLLRFKMLTPEMARLFEGVVKARLNILISGGTGSGKTTFLNTLSRFIPDRERIVTIEDAAELQLQQRHVVPLETRPPNVEGKGQVTTRDLVRNCLRMRPDRIVVGECRGAEALDMLQAMNTGHDGSLTTLHANTPRDALSRLETMIMMTGFELPIKAMRQQISSAIDLIIQANRLQGGPRKITSITEVMNMEQDVIIMQEVFRFRQLGIDQNSRAFGQFESTGVRPTFINRLEAKGVKLPSNMFAERILMRD